MTQKSFNKEYWVFLWSSILIALSACLGTVLDAIIVGNLIDEDSVSAINISRTMIQFMFTLSMLLAMGAGMLVGMQLGKKDTRHASYIFTVSMVLCVVAGLVIAALGLMFPDASTRLFCNNERFFEPTKAYLVVMMLGAPVYLLMWGLDTMVSVDGSPKLVSFSIFVDNAVHLVLDFVFIKYFGWGIASSSVATVIGHVVGIAFMAFHFLSSKNNLRLVWRSDSKLYTLNSTLKNIISQGAPLAIASICLTLLLFTSNRIVLSALGRAGIFAFSLCMYLLQIYNLFLSGVCRTIQSLGSIQVGKGDNRMFKLVLRKSFNFITVAMIITCAYVWIWPESIAVFFGAKEPELIANANNALRIFALSFIPFCYINAILIVYKLYGYHKMAMFISFALSLTVIPVMCLIVELAPNYLWYSYLIAYIIEIVVIFLIHRIGHLKFELKTMAAVIVLLFSVTTVAAADNQASESKLRFDHLCDLYNNDKNDSLILQAPIDMAFHKKEGNWDYYYETWMHWVNTYVFMGRVNTALKEVRVMHQDAMNRNDKYGMALANYAMGNAYINMGHLDEAIVCYKQSLELIDHTNVSDPVVNDIFSYYCDALNEKKDYQTMSEITKQWKTYIDKVSQEKDTRQRSSDIWYSYYYLACAQQNIGLGRLDEAKIDIDEAEKRKIDGTTFIQMSILYYKAQLYLRQGDYTKALEYNTQRMKESKAYDDKSSTVLIYEQRGEIMQGLGRFEEAAQMFKAVHELTDSIYKKDVRTQITELSTLFRVNELDMEKRLERNRFIAMTAIIISIALALLVGYWYWMNRRLKKKNEELAIARDKAQESSRMKADFISNISHEIRTPLNILSGFAQILSQPDLVLSPETTREASMEIQTNTNRITSLINRLLALSESSSRSVLERTDTINVNQLCLNAISQSKVGDSRQWAFNFESKVADDLTIVAAEQYAVSALCHLLDNAMKFTPDGGTINLCCQTTDDQLVISIEDTGCGVPEEKADEIFTEFVQLDEYKEGVGIGLTVSRNIARRLGGDVTLDTSYNGGARFLLTLPLQDNQ